MPKYKNIRIKKRGGGTRLQRVQVQASGKYKFVKNTGTRSSTKRKTSKRKVNKTAKRRRRYKKKTNRKSTKRRIPLSVITSATTALYAAPQPGWSSVMTNIQARNIPGALQSLLASYTGILLPLGGQQTFAFNPMEALNPFDLRYAPAWKAGFWTKMVTKLIRKVAGNPFTRIPFIKDYVSFS